MSFKIISIEQDLKSIYVAGDQTQYFVPGLQCLIEGSTNNDGVCFIDSSSFVNGETKLNLVEPLRILTADGTITFGEYEINFADPAKVGFIVLPQEIETHHTSIGFPGRGTIEYGETINEDLLHILENFSSPVSPINPIEGQLWFSSTTKKLMVYNTNRWEETNAVYSSNGVPPESPVVGQLWFDLYIPQLKVWDGVVWKSVADRYLLKSGDTMSGDIDMGTNSVTNVKLPSNQYDAANKLYVDQGDSAITNTVTNHLNNNAVHLTTFQNNLLDGLNPALTSTEINYSHGVTSAIQTQLDTITQAITLLGSVNGPIQTQINDRLKISTGGTMKGNIIMSPDTIITLPVPTLGFQSTDAVNKSYVDSLVASLLNEIGTTTIKKLSYVAAQGQTVFPVMGGYSTNTDVFVNGVRLSPTDVDLTDKMNVVLSQAADVGDIIDVITYTAYHALASTELMGKYSYVAVQDQTVFPIQPGYNSQYSDIYLNGVKLPPSDLDVNDINFIKLLVGANAGDVLDVVSFAMFNVADVYTKTQTDAKYSAVGSTTPKDGDVKVVGSVIYIYASGTWRQVFPAKYS